LKVSSLLTQYLYQNKLLNLPGIGQFSIGPAVAIPEPTDKNFHDFLQQIEFSPKASARMDDNLIDYIRQKTGKIKPLAESDLESFVADCKTMLNIGKPLYLEGIGTLQKNKEGRYDFVHGMVMSERAESMHPEAPIEKHGDKRFLYRTEYTDQASQTNILRRLLIAAGIVVGLGVIIWGGYLLYTKKAGPPEEITVNTNNAAQEPVSPSVQPADSTTIDSNAVLTPAPAPAPVTTAATGTYKFICEVTKTRQRGIDRFKRLKELDSRYQMETTDSVHFTIFVRLPAAPGDTIRIKDSLRAWYWGTIDRRIRIEQ